MQINASSSLNTYKDLIFICGVVFFFVKRHSMENWIFAVHVARTAGFSYAVLQIL